MQPTNTVIYARFSLLYKSIMPFNIAMKPKNQHIPIIKLTYIYLIRLPIRLSINYQVKQVNTEVSKKHRSTSTYNNPNILILIIIPCKYLVIIIPFPKVIPPCNYLVKHKLELLYGKYAPFPTFFNHLVQYVGYTPLIRFGKLFKVIQISFGGSKCY